MNDDHSIYLRRTVRRLRLMAFSFILSYGVSAVSLFPLCSYLLGNTLGMLAPMTIAAGSALLTAGGLTTVAHFLHKSFWPESADEE